MQEDSFLKYLKENQVWASIHLSTGVCLRGYIVEFGKNMIMISNSLEDNVGNQKFPSSHKGSNAYQCIYKKNITSISVTSSEDLDEFRKNIHKKGKKSIDTDEEIE